MRWYAGPPDDHGRAGDGGEDGAQGLQYVPMALLRRHGARLLSPPDAAAIRGWPAPRSTIYRARTLLVPEDLLRERLAALNRALAGARMHLVPPPSDGDQQVRARQSRPGERGRLPRIAVLVPAGPEENGGPPVVVDAWVALQALRAASMSDEHPDLSQEDVRRIGLEHELVGSAIAGVPISDGGGVTGGPISDGGGVGGSGSTASYLFGGDARIPVQVCLGEPTRESLGRCRSRYGRRPVIAVLDSGVRAHRWLDVSRDPSHPGRYSTAPDGFVAVDQWMQDTIYQQGLQAASASDHQRQLIADPWDRPFTDDPLVGGLASHIGHGTFISGIVRQVVPEAQVLSVRIMHSDGIVNEGDLTCALGLIADRVAAAQDSDMSQMIDVVSLSLGYFSETTADDAYSTGLWLLIDELLRLGVVVTAAAGNYATSRRFYPAGFADRMVPGQPPLISVGALNPDGSKALFSDDGSWVHAWALGAGVVSTFPADINGSRTPPDVLPAHLPGTLVHQPPLAAQRTALDPDDFRGGWSIWAGTSFSAPYVAAEIVREMLAGAEADNGLRLDRGGADSAASRAMRALTNLGWPG